MPKTGIEWVRLRIGHICHDDLATQPNPYQPPQLVTFACETGSLRYEYQSFQRHQALCDPSGGQLETAVGLLFTAQISGRMMHFVPSCLWL